MAIIRSKQETSRTLFGFDSKNDLHVPAAVCLSVSGNDMRPVAKPWLDLIIHDCHIFKKTHSLGNDSGILYFQTTSSSKKVEINVDM